MLNLRSVFKNCVDNSLSDGVKFSFWFDPWFNGQPPVDKFPWINVKGLGVSKKPIVKIYGKRAGGHFLLL